VKVNVDPNEPRMPAKPAWKRTMNFAKALVRGKPGDCKIVIPLFRDKPTKYCELHDGMA